MDLSNFYFLKHHDELLVRLAQTAETCFVPDPNTTLIKMRQLGEELAKTIASRVGVESGACPLFRLIVEKLSLNSET